MTTTAAPAAPAKPGWLGSAGQRLKERFPQGLARERASWINQRLSALLLERLPGELSTRLVDLLPASERAGLPVSGFPPRGETSIGYPDFVERVGLALGQPIDEERCREIADAFLQIVLREIPDSFKAEVARSLPAELRSKTESLEIRRAA